MYIELTQVDAMTVLVQTNGKEKEVASAYYLLCPRYDGPLNSIAPTANRMKHIRALCRHTQRGLLFFIFIGKRKIKKHLNKNKLINNTLSKNVFINSLTC